MAFGGAVKLTGESEYRKALQQINQSLKEVTSQMKVTSSVYDKNDNSVQALNARSKDLNNVLTQQKSKLSNLESQYKSMMNQYRNSTNEHTKLVATYDKEKAKLDDIEKSLGKSSKEYQQQKVKVDECQKALTKSTQAMAYNEQETSKMRIEMNKTQVEINKTTKEIDQLGKETQETGKQVENASDGFTVFKGVVADLASKAIQSAISGLKKLGTAVVNVGKEAISSYAEYEQLVGGVETLFKESAPIVQQYAENAYKTAGMSANEYMEQATSFSASLLQGLGGDTKKAAEIADMAITDMSDNANKMGTSMEMLTNAYGGFAKQNYTMLDNLKLGYGGTKAEMARLVKESGILGKAGEDLTATNLDQKVSFDQIIKEINKVQQNMGITGTTSKEAASTIEGSVKSMKSSWKNLLTAIADDNKDLGKSVNEFVESTITASKNLVPRVKVVVEGIKKLINSIVTEAFPKLKKEIPELAPLISVFEWFITHKNAVVGSIQLMITAFAVNKILNFTKGMTDLAKQIIQVANGTTLATTSINANTTAQVANTTAQVAGATATGLLTKATNLLNAAWKANPIGLVVTGITALIGVVGLLKNKTDEATKAEKEQQEALKAQTEEIQRNKDSWDDLVKSKQNAINTGMSEISHYEALYDELTEIVDANGKVKKGYEERASFITSTLSEALGIEIQTVDGVVQKYGDLKNSIDEVMEKKKAQIILDSQESLYTEAINKQGEALQKLNDFQGQLNSKKEERARLDAEYNSLAEEYNKAQVGGNLDVMKSYILQMSAVQGKMNKLDEETTNIQKNYDEQKGLLEEYAYNIGLYESNMAAAHAGEYDKMNTVNWNYVKDYQEAEDAQKAMLEDQIKVTETNLNLLKELKEKSGSDLYDSQIKASEKLLKEQKDSLKKYNSATEKDLKKTTVIWNDNLDDQLSEITGAKVEFKEDGKGNVTAYIDGVKSGETKSKEEMAKLVSKTIKEISKQETGAKTAGEDLIDGVNNGVANERKQSGVFSTIANFGSKLLGKLRASLEEHSPSKATNEMGQFLLQGLGIGIEDEETDILKQVSNFGKSVISSLNSGLSGNIDTTAISNIKNSIPRKLSFSGSNNTVNSNSNNANNRDTVEEFKEALSQMQIVMDDEPMGKFVDKTVARAIYT